MCSENVQFIKLSHIFERIINLSGDIKKRKIIEEFFNEWRITSSKLNPSDKDNTFYPVIRLFLPQLDKDREAYGIKEHTLALLYIEILGLGKTTINGQRLLNYKSPKTGNNDTGDFASIAYSILKDRCPTSSNLSIADINKSLSDLAHGHVSKNKIEVKKTLRQLIMNTSALEQKWIIRIIMRDMKLGIGVKGIFKAYHPDAEDLYNVKMSLEKVCYILTDLSIRLHEIEISINTPFRPMLGERLSPSSVEKTFKGKPYFVEIKYDGERMQIHYANGEFKYFSRGGNDYTQAYGNNDKFGNLTPYIAYIFHKSVKNCILDGEMVGFDPNTHTIGTKAEHFDVKSSNLGEYQPMFCVFDILLLNDKVLSNLPLRERKVIIKDLLPEVVGRLVISKHVEKNTSEECMDALNHAIDCHEEGIMVKDPESIYKPNKRSKSGWYKIKPDYIGGLMDELDLLIIGGYFGIGSRSNMLSHFLLGVAVDNDEIESHPEIFQSVCKVGSGYTHKELFELNTKLAPHWVTYKKEKLPSWVLLADGFKQRPDALISHPSKSVILQIRASEITDTDQYKTGLTLRFPRVEKIRSDKPWFDCMTVSQLINLKQEYGGKLASKHFTSQMLDVSSSKRAKLSKKAQLSLPAHLQAAIVQDIVQISDIFEGKEICVISGTDSFSKVEIEKQILELSGTIVQNPGSNTFCVLAGKMTIKVQNLMKNSIYNIATVDWLNHCLERNQILEWEPSDLISCSNKLKNQIALKFDDFGDSYLNQIDEVKLHQIFESMPAQKDILSNQAIKELEDKYFPLDSSNGLFRLCSCYLVKENFELDIIELDLRLHGAQILTNQSNKLISHVVINRHSKDVDKFKKLNRNRKKKFHIVNTIWVTASIQSGKLLPENQYPPIN